MGSGNERPLSAGWWKRALHATWIACRDLFWDDGPHWAAAIAYYSLLSFIPILVLVVLVASVFIDSGEAVDRIGQLLEDLLPEGDDGLEQILEQAYQGRATAGFVSVLALLWSGTRIFSSTSRALNVAYDVEQTHGIVHRFLIQVGLLLFVGSLFVLGLFARALVDAVWQSDAWGAGGGGTIASIGAALLPFLLTTLGFFIVYRFVPRHRPTWIPALIGSVIAAGLFWSGRALFFLYLRHFGDYSAVYGPLALIIIVILWIWFAALIMLFCGQLVSHYEEIMVEGESPQDVERRHRRVREARDRPGEHGRER